MRGAPQSENWQFIVVEQKREDRVTAIMPKGEFDVPGWSVDLRAATKREWDRQDPEGMFVVGLFIGLPKPEFWSITLMGKGVWHVKSTFTFVDKFNAPYVEVTKSYLDEGFIRMDGSLLEVQSNDAQLDEFPYYVVANATFTGFAKSQQALLLVVPSGTGHTDPGGSAHLRCDLSVTINGPMTFKQLRGPTLDQTGEPYHLDSLFGVVEE